MTSINYGDTPPMGTSALQLTSVDYYDVLVSSAVSIASGAVASVSISNSEFTSQSVVSYWDGSTWIPFVTIFTAPDTVSFSIPVSDLAGTPFAVNNLSPFFVTLESQMDTLSALLACFANVTAFTAFKKKTGKQPRSAKRNIA